MPQKIHQINDPTTKGAGYLWYLTQQGSPEGWALSHSQLQRYAEFEPGEEGVRGVVALHHDAYGCWTASWAHEHHQVRQCRQWKEVQSRLWWSQCLVFGGRSNTWKINEHVFRDWAPTCVVFQTDFECNFTANMSTHVNHPKKRSKKASWTVKCSRYQ